MEPGFLLFSFKKNKKLSHFSHLFPLFFPSLPFPLFILSLSSLITLSLFHLSGSFTYILNYAHTLETLGNYGAALDKLLYYLSLNLDFSLSRSSSVSVSCREVMEIVRVLREREGEEKERKGEEGEGEGKEGFGEMRMDRVAHAKDCLVLHSKGSLSLSLFFSLCVYFV